MQRLLLVMLGGALGTGARYVLLSWARMRWDTALPMGTLAVNLLGCLLLGALTQAASHGGWISEDARWMLSVGLLGGFTTYSTFNQELLSALQGAQWLPALLYAALTFFGGLAAGVAGMVAVRLIGGA